MNSIQYEFIVSNLRQATKLLSENLTLAEKINYPEGVAESSAKLGLAYYLSGEYEKSTSAYLKAISIYEDLDLSERLSETLGEFGYQLKRRDLNRANRYMMAGIKLAEQNNFQLILAKLYDNYGVLKEMENNLDSAMFYYERSLEIKERFNDLIGIPYSLNKLAGVYSMKGNFNTALEFVNRSDEYRNKETGDFGRIENIVLYADIYQRMGRDSKAIELYSSALESSKKNNINYLIRYCYQQLTELYRKKGDFKNALSSHIAFTSYKDSVLNAEVNTKIAELEIDYETEKKDKELAESKLEIEARNFQLMLAGVALILLLIGIAGIYRYQQIKKQKLLSELELKNKIKQAEYEQKISEEKLRISRELHDNIGSQLTFMISSIDNIGYSVKDEKFLSRLGKLSSFGRETLGELRNTIWAMKNEETSLEALELKLKDIKSQFSETIENIELNISNTINRKIELSSTQVLDLFRISQEAIQNALKYSGCSKIEILFQDFGQGIQMIISDDGAGFDVEKINRGNGLDNMRHRAERAGGALKIDSGEKGTTVVCQIEII